MKKGLKALWGLVNQAIQAWGTDNAAQMAAAIAYFTIFSIPPLLIIALAVTGHFVDTVTAKSQLIAQLGGVIGPQATDFLKTLLDNSVKTASSPIASIIGVVVLLAGAMGVFFQVHYALNRIWKVPKKPAQSLIKTVKDQALVYLTILGMGVIFLVTLLLSMVLSALIGKVNGLTGNIFLLQVLNFFILFVTISILIAVVYRVIPDKAITWRDVWLGAAVTGLLFMLGKYAIGFYLTISNSGSAYGAAGSLIVLLVWIFYSTQIFLFGAEFTHAYSLKFGTHAEAAVIEKSPDERGPHQKG
jgi:membrane protein